MHDKVSMHALSLCHSSVVIMLVFMVVTTGRPWLSGNTDVLYASSVPSIMRHRCRRERRSCGAMMGRRATASGHPLNFEDQGENAKNDEHGQ